MQLRNFYTYKNRTCRVLHLKDKYVLRFVILTFSQVFKNIKALGLRYTMETEFGSYQLAIFNNNERCRNPISNVYCTITTHQYRITFQGFER